VAGQCGNEAGPDRRTDSKVNANGSSWMPLGSHRRSPPPRRTRSTADVGSCLSCHPPNGIRCRRSDCWRSRFYSGLAERHGAKVSFEQSRAPAWASVFHQGQGPKIKIKPERLVSEQHNPPARGCSGDADGAIYVVFRCDRLRHIAAMRHRAEGRRTTCDMIGICDNRKLVR